jgi:hypothetical protein
VRQALKINRAIQFCKLPRAAQLEQFIRYSEERATNRVIRRSILQPNDLNFSLTQTPRSMIRDNVPGLGRALDFDFPILQVHDCSKSLTAG